MMAKTERDAQSTTTDSMSGWFRKIFQEHPSWLKGRSNAAVIAQWESDHPGKKFGPSERNACNNTKSILRKRLRKRGRKAADPDAAPAVSKALPRILRTSLELLEERIDDCISLARTLDREGLDSVAKLLRRARNEVVWKQGQ